MTSLGNQTWATDKDTIAVMKALATAGGAPRFVGGCVRNALLKLPADDIDIATILLPDAALAALQKAGFKTIPTGIEHGTITVVTTSRSYEVTSLRRDVETDGRRAVVAFTQDWSEDAARRDFTINALYADMGGQVFDPTGQGEDDLKAGSVRFIGDGNARIQEDYLRILRFFRFHAIYGRGEFDTEGLRACATHAAGIEKLSGERIQKEMLRLLAADEPVAALRAMATAGILPTVLPGQLNFNRLQKMTEIERDAFMAPDAVLRLAALLGSDDAQARSIADRWRLSNKDRDRLIALSASPAPKIVPYLSIREVRRTLYQIGTDIFVDFCRLRWAEDTKPANQMQWRAMIAMGRGWVRPKFPLSGAQVMQAGVAAGPRVGFILSEVEAWWIDSDFIDDEFSIIERLKAIVQATN